MRVMETEELFTEMSAFLRVTLGNENLTHHAQRCRQQLITKLTMRHTSPPPPVHPPTSPQTSYIDMTCGHSHTQLTAGGDTYEVFDTDKEVFLKRSTDNMLYTNEPSNDNIYLNDCNTENHINVNQMDEDNMYTIPSSPMANLPVGELLKPSPPAKNPPSNSSSGRNSMVEKTSSDTISLSSSSTKNDEFPEVCSISASALRYTAAKCGPLGRRGKMFIIGHTKTYWAAAHHNTLYLFVTDKDYKPSVQMDLTGYTARPCNIMGISKTDFRFELVAPGKRTHQFVTEKQSDMDAWIAALNSERLLCSRDEPDMGERQDSMAHLIPDESESVYAVPSTDPSCGSQMSMGTFQRERPLELQDVRYVTKQDMERCSSSTRQLPLLPHQKTQTTYNLPPAQPWPVESTQETHPSCPVSQMDDSFSDENYYMVPEVEMYNMPPNEEIYDVIKDAPPLQQPQKPVIRNMRELPCLPQGTSTYDRPDSSLRPVKPITPEPPEQKDLYYNTISNTNEKPFPDPPEEVYYNIDENHSKGVKLSDSEECYYNLAENSRSSVTSSVCNEQHTHTPTQVAYGSEKEDNNETYYSLEKDRDQEQVYDVISETRPHHCTVPKIQIPTKLIGFGVNMSFVNDLSKKLEERERRNSAAKTRLAPVKKTILNKGYQ